MVAERAPSPIEQLRIELAATQLRLEHVEAQRTAELDALVQLVRIVERTGGYMAPEHQAVLGDARALLAEAGR